MPSTLSLALAWGPASAAAPPELRETFRSAYSEVKSCLLNANLLLASSQASLKRIESSATRLGMAGLKAAAQGAFQDHTAGLRRFREAADAADAGPRSPEPAEAAPAKAQAAREVPAATDDILSEIFELRSTYDAAASLRAKASARQGASRLDAALGARPLTAGQRRVLGDGRALARTLGETARRLRGRLPAQGKGAASGPLERDLRALSDDASALGVELDLLETRYRLNNHFRLRPEFAEDP